MGPGPTAVVMGQASLEHHVWQVQRLFEPMSHTAEVFMGPIKLSGTPHFARRWVSWITGMAVHDAYVRRWVSRIAGMAVHDS